MADCKKCETKTIDADSVPYVVHESEMARAERTAKRLWIAVLILIFLLVGTNAAWLYYESSFEEIEITQENADGYNNFIGNDGDIWNGETNDQNP